MHHALMVTIACGRLSQEAEGGGQMQGISLVICPHSPQKLKTIAYKTFSPSLSPFNLLLSLFYHFKFIFNSGSVFTKQELLKHLQF